MEFAISVSSLSSPCLQMSVSAVLSAPPLIAFEEYGEIKILLEVHELEVHIHASISFSCG